MATETDWRSRLQAASFRGVPFSVENDESTFGRRVQVHEYPNRDKPYTEDIGRATRRIQLDAYLIGDDYPEQRDRLIAAIETAGPATLVHPYYGEMRGSVDGTVRIIHSRDEGRMCRVSFSFVESGELSFPTSGIASGQRLESSVSFLEDAISSVMSALSLDGLSDFVQSEILGEGANMLGVITDAFKMVDSGIDAAMRLLKGDLSVILMPPSTANDFVRALQTAWRGGTRLAGDASDLVTMIKTISGIAIDPGLAPRGVWDSDAGTTRTRKQVVNSIGSAIRVTAIAEAARAVTAIPAPPRVASAGDNVSDIVNISHPALDAATDAAQSTTSFTVTESGQVASSYTSTETPSATWDDLTDVRTALNHAIDVEQLRTTDDGVFLALSTLRTDVNRDISQRLAQVEKTVTRTPSEPKPAIVLAAEWFDDASRETEILYRNNIAHPGFVPVRALRVPVK